MCLVAALAGPEQAPALSAAEGLQPQTYQAPKARRHFISISFDRQFVQPYSFAKHPLEELLGQPVDEVFLQSFEYRTRDQQTLVNVVEYGRSRSKANKRQASAEIERIFKLPVTKSPSES